MKKMQVTRKQLQAAYENILTVGYCHAQRLLVYQDAKYYNAGKNGWNFDAYEINENTVLVTGYQTGFAKYPHANYDICMEYQKKADTINETSHWSEKESKINALLQQFVDEVLRGAKND
jgi:hypothetical protein